MRADLTDMPGYWDAIINSAPDGSPTTKRELIYMKRNFHNPYDQRWFGGFKQWLQKINTLTNANSISRNFHWSDKYTIYHAEVGGGRRSVQLCFSHQHAGIVPELPVQLGHLRHRCRSDQLRVRVRFRHVLPLPVADLHLRYYLEVSGIMRTCIILALIRSLHRLLSYHPLSSKRMCT
jgi:hypothetical protein